MEVPFPVVHSDHKVEVKAIIRRSPIEVYTYWRNLENHAMFIESLESVEVLDQKRSRWVWTVKPFGEEAEWTSEIIADIPGKMLSWQTLPGSSIQQAGSVWFKSLPDGSTEVHWQVAWDPPAGEFGAAAAKILGEDPAHTMREDLNRLRAMLEGGRLNSLNENPSMV